MKSGYPRSNYRQAFGAVRYSLMENIHIMKRYGGLSRPRQNEIRRTIVEQRKAVARELIGDSSLRHLTLLLDGKTFRLRAGQKNQTKTLVCLIILLTSSSRVVAPAAGGVLAGFICWSKVLGSMHGGRSQ